MSPSQQFGDRIAEGVGRRDGGEDETGDKMLVEAAAAAAAALSRSPPGQLLPRWPGFPRFPCLSMASKVGRVLADGMLETTLKAVEEGQGAWPFLSGTERRPRVGLGGRGPLQPAGTKLRMQE